MSARRANNSDASESGVPHLVRLEALSLHAVFPEGQDAVLETHCRGGDKGKTEAQKAARHFLRPLLCESSPTHSMEKSKLSSEASFLLDFSLPWRFTIFKFSAEKNKKKKRHKRSRLPELLPSAEEVLTVQTHQHRVPLQLGDVDGVHLLIIWGENKKKPKTPPMIRFSEPQTSLICGGTHSFRSL